MHPLRALSVALVTTALAGSLVCGSAFASSASTSTKSSSEPKELRNVRYCEVIPSVLQGDTVTTYVYNTLGQNYCPADKWDALTEAEVNQEFGSQAAKLNGPRYWVLDHLKATGGETESGKPFTFGGIKMNLRATLTTPAGQPTVGEQAYVPNQVQRETIFTYKAGKPIFELTSPEGDVYVMQSYAQILDKTLTIKQLPDLATKLTLPPGWSYKSRTPSKDLKLEAKGVAYVVNDNLANSYQRRT